MLTHLTTYHGSLPQGAPTSPHLANALMYSIDEKLYSKFPRLKSSYGRYGDDILVFSKFRIYDFAQILLRELSNINTLKLNVDKTDNDLQSIKSARAGRTALGITFSINGIGVSRQKRKKLKSILLNCIKTGIEMQNIDSKPNFEAHLAGRIAEVKMFHPSEGETLSKIFSRARNNPNDKR